MGIYNSGNPFDDAFAPTVVMNIHDNGVSFGQEESQPINTTTIPEDNLKNKILSCIPFMGAYFELKNQLSLNNRIMETQDLTLKSRLVKVLNDYKICGIVRNILSIALAVGTVALIILSGGSAAIPLALAGSAIGIFLFRLSKNAYEIHKNKQHIKQWELSQVNTTNNLASAYGKST